jgi:hypothetical protein
VVAGRLGDGARQRPRSWVGARSSSASATRAEERSFSVCMGAGENSAPGE